MANATIDSIRAYMERCARDGTPPAPTVSLSPLEYADKLAKTRAGAYSCDFGDEDGLCDFFIRDGDLHLRTAGGIVKLVVHLEGVMGIHESENERSTSTPSSPRGRFLDYCHFSGVTLDHGVKLLVCLKNDSLLDNFVGFKPRDNPSAAFIYVAKFQDDGANLPQLLPVLHGCLKSLDIFLALVHGAGEVNILQLVEQMRRVPLADTNARLQAAGAQMLLLRRMHVTPSQEETGPVGAPAEAVRACASCGRREPASGERLRLCGGCSHVFYCDAACQRSHWGAHKAACRRKAAAGAKAAAAGGKKS